MAGVVPTVPSSVSVMAAGVATGGILVGVILAGASTPPTFTIVGNSD